MATVAMEHVSIRTRWFYVFMAWVCVAIAIGLFAPTFWLQLPAGTFVGTPLLYLHAILFSVWPLFFVSQATLAATGRMEHHRAWGLLGVALATAMLLIGIATATEVLSRRLDDGFGDAARAFYIVPFSGVVIFAAFVAAAIANVSRPETHKRLMLLASLWVVQAAVARMFFALNVGIGPGMRPGLGQPLPVETSVLPSLVVDAIMLAAIAYDWRAHGRLHPAYLIGGGIMLFVQFARIPFSHTEAWYAITSFLVSFSGAH